MTPDSLSQPLSWQIFVLIICVILLALITMTNTAMESVSRSKVRQMLENDENDSRARRLDRIINNPARYRSTNRLIGFLLTAGGTVQALALPYHPAVCVLLFILAALIFGEIFPRKFAKQHSLPAALRCSALQSVLCGILLPVTGAATLIANLFLKLFRQQTDIDEREYSEDEVLSILEVGQQSGEIREEGRKMINSIFEFDDELAYEIMTPRTDVFMIDINDPPEEYFDRLMELRYTRMPVCEDDSDNIIGILHIKDYLIKAREDGYENVDIKKILRKPYFVPETKKIDTLFFELQKEKQHIAILIDEYGGFSGIVTLEDIIEEIVGDIDDEYDEEDEIIEKISDNEYLIDGNVNLDDLNEELGTDLESENSETIGGYLIDIMGEIPSDGYVNREIRIENYTFIIISVKERRIERVKLIIHDTSEEQEPSEKEDGDA